MKYLFQILSGRPIMGNSMDEVLKKRRLQQLGKKQRNKTELELLKLGPPPKYIISPELLQDTLSLAKDTASTLLQIKQKGSPMSQQDNKPFQWDEQKIREFAEYYRKTQGNVTPELWGKDLLETFKASHISSEKVENDWEVLSYFSEIGGNNILTKNKDGTFGQFFAKESDLQLSSLFSIHSVRRKSDGEVFSIGDMCDTLIPGKIEHIRVDGKHCTLGGEKWGCPLSRAEKVTEKPVLFTTEDGVKIFAGQTYWQVEDFEVRTITTHLEDNGEWYKHQKNTFSTVQAAREYVIMNKPCLSVEDVHSWLEKGAEKIGLDFEALELIAKSKIKGGK